jgi:DNA-binding NarL/FixJ family response regulator
MSNDIRVLLADDHALVRRGVRLILDDSPGLRVVAEASNGAEALELARAGGIDLAVLDVAMPGMTGLQAAREIASREPHPHLLMLSMYDNEQYFFEALRVGAAGYVLKSVADQELVDACYAAVRGQAFVSPGTTRALVKSYLERLERGESLPSSVLTSREEEVVKLIAEGHSSREIASALFISVKTVERHRANVLEKLGMNDRTQLTRFAMRVGLIEP